MPVESSGAKVPAGQFTQVIKGAPDKRLRDPPENVVDASDAHEIDVPTLTEIGAGKEEPDNDTPATVSWSKPDSVLKALKPTIPSYVRVIVHVREFP